MSTEKSERSSGGAVERSCRVAPANPSSADQAYRGPWQDKLGSCSKDCPAYKKLDVTNGDDRTWHECRIDGSSCPDPSPCYVRSMHEALRRGPGGT